MVWIVGVPDTERVRLRSPVGLRTKGHRGCTEILSRSAGVWAEVFGRSDCAGVEVFEITFDISSR